MSNQFLFALIITAIAFSLLTKCVYCSESENVTDTEEKFVCPEVITEIQTDKETERSMAKVRMQRKCNPNYTTNEDIKEKCEQLPTNDNRCPNQFLITSVINTKNNILYWNMYCSICKLDHKFEFKDPVLEIAASLNFQINWPKDSQDYRSIFCDHILPALVTKGPSFIPKHLLTDEYYCDSTSNISQLYDAAHRFHEKYWHNSSHPIFCPESSFRSERTCTYGSDLGKRCDYNNMFLHEGVNFTYSDNGQIKAPLFHEIKFLPNEYSKQTGIYDVIFLCGQEENRMDDETATIVFYSMSIILFMLCVVFTSSRQYLQSLHNRVLYSFCITRAMYFIFNLLYCVPLLDKWCVPAFFTILWIAISSLLWLLLVIFEYGHQAYNNSIRRRRVPGPAAEVQTKKYLIYCLVCWILSAISTTLAMFFVILDDEKPPSRPTVGGYSLVSCEFHINSDQYPILFEILDKVILVYLVIIILEPLITAFIKTHLLWKKIKSRPTSDSTETYLLNYAKIMFVMALYLAFFWYYRVSLFIQGISNSTIIVFYGVYADFMFIGYLRRRNLMCITL